MASVATIRLLKTESTVNQRKRTKTQKFRPIVTNISLQYSNISYLSQFKSIVYRDSDLTTSHLKELDRRKTTKVA